MAFTCPNCHRPLDDNASSVTVPANSHSPSHSHSHSHSHSQSHVHVHGHSRSSSLVDPSALNTSDLRAALQRLRADNEILSRKLVEAVELRADLEDALSMQNTEHEQLRIRESKVTAELTKL